MDERNDSDTDNHAPTRREFLGGTVLIAAALDISLPLETAAQQAGKSVAPAPPSGLLCDLMAFPERVAITNSHPTFAWIVEDTSADAVQHAYQIQVAARPDLLEKDRPDLWDSGRVSSDRSCGVVYAGKPLPPASELFWRVRTWNAHGSVSPFSVAQRFKTGEFTAPRTAPRYPIAHTEVHPAAIVDKGDGRWFVDFGKAAFGRLRLTVSSGMAGKKISVALGEATLGADKVNTRPGASIRYTKAEVTLTEPSVLLPGKVMPFRYAEIEGVQGKLEAASVFQIMDHYPFDDAAAHFHCSDPVLNDVWELCKYSIKATSFAGVYIDGDRERTPYEADAYINQLGHYCVDREYTLARYSHEYLMKHATWPTEWPLHSVLIAWNDYLYTGDTGSLSIYYDDLKAKTLSALAREDGLISTTTGRVTKDLLSAINAPRLQDIVDWPAGERDGFQFSAFNSVVNAFHFRAVQLMSRIAEAVGRSDDAQTYRRQAVKIGQSFARSFYDPARGLYRDGEGADHFSLHANVFPLAFGLGPGRDRVAPTLRMLKQKGMACSVYAAQYLLEALYNVGAADYALALMTAKTDRSWAHMLYDVGSTITLEAWDRKYKPNLDWNHAWGAAPANIIPRRLMGIEPDASSPGFRSLSIKPQTASLRYGEIRLPTIAGAIEMRFTADPGRSFRMETQIPANTVATVQLPDFGSPPLMDGKKAKNPLRDRAGFWQITAVGSGTHHFESRR